MEGDQGIRHFRKRRSEHFNPLPPHGGRLTTAGVLTWQQKFQSTPSAWRETATGAALGRMLWISIHSLRMEGDLEIPDSPIMGNVVFQSTPSAWRETQYKLVASYYCGISIHSLRMEGDCVSQDLYSPRISFQSTPSAWRETTTPPPFVTMIEFQSTPSAWRETFHHR